MYSRILIWFYLFVPTIVNNNCIITLSKELFPLYSEDTKLMLEPPHHSLPKTTNQKSELITKTNHAGVSPI